MHENQQIIVSIIHHFPLRCNRLGGLVVRASASFVGDCGFDPKPH